MQAFPERTDIRLREFVADEYHRCRRHEDAMALMWTEFSEHPHLGTYQTLEKHAKKARAWPEWRDRALAEVRRRSANSHSILVEIFLYEDKSEDAWREAVAGGCSDSLWLRLAAEREKYHPEDAAPLYVKYADAAVAAVSNGRYEDSVALLAKAAVLMRRPDRGADFVRHLEALRAKFKIKRNFIKLVEQKRKSLYIA